MLNWLFSTSYGPYTGYNNYWNNPQPISTSAHDFSAERLHALEMACAGLWELLKQKNGYTDDELKSVISSLGNSPAPLNSLGDQNLTVCPKCHHKLLTKNHTKCLWCGADLPQEPFTH